LPKHNILLTIGYRTQSVLFIKLSTKDLN